MILYYSPGACSLADHIALSEAGLKFELEKVDLKTHTTKDGRDFRNVNPKGYVPALQFDDGSILTENVAILTMIADNYSPLAVPGNLGRYRLIEMLSYISSELHGGFKPLFGSNTSSEDKAQAIKALEKKFEYVASQFKGDYLFGENASAADAYLFVMLLWAGKFGIKVPDVLNAFRDKMRSRPTVSAVLKAEGLG
ncbi:glutathione S-transferase [Hyphomicrobium methylovorum]|uniref:glutathione S-transferase N-terminal domain-containing protein n=1 Tax=Hyphomicrobium methylovorum TaxID=84 RepID=UPI0015E6DD51|nr:glutathione S-transferase N-terminal domain-containing protein [Hyphomicrobium methylovorum]MBA2126311.1 glutathione S-transferase [Hyphomicrobium methylovorum]